MTPTEERAILGRAAEVASDHVCDGYGCNCKGVIRDEIQALPLESKEVEAKPVGKIFGYNEDDAQGVKWRVQDVEWLTDRPLAEGALLYTTPQPCPKCAELASLYKQVSESEEIECRRAEAAEAKCAERQAAVDRMTNSLNAEMESAAGWKERYRKEFARAEAAEDSALQWKSKFELEHKMKCEWITRAEKAEGRCDVLSNGWDATQKVLQEKRSELAESAREYERQNDKLRDAEAQLAKVREDIALWRENWSELLPDTAMAEFDSIGEKP